MGLRRLVVADADDEAAAAAAAPELPAQALHPRLQMAVAAASADLMGLNL